MNLNDENDHNVIFFQCLDKNNFWKEQNIRLSIELSNEYRKNSEVCMKTEKVDVNKYILSIPKPLVIKLKFAWERFDIIHRNTIRCTSKLMNTYTYIDMDAHLFEMSY